MTAILCILLGLFFLFSTTGLADNQIQSGDEAIIDTSTVHTGFLKQQDDISAVTQVVLRERQARDRGWWGQMMLSYWPDSHVALSWYNGDGPGFVRGSKVLYDRGSRPVHRMFAPIVDIKDNRAHVEIHTMVWADTKVNGKLARMNAFMRLNYKLSKRENEWRILSFKVIYEYTEIRPSIPGEIVSIPAEELKKHRRSYDVLSWDLTQKGINVSQDQLGEDQPETVKVFYRGIKAWLRDGS
ncbi:MAG: nuclear transport factor 2 family protein [Emcibacter sp.]|nr:nuclear transport factor 2 family protein [Emcibacter sp.]